MVSMQLNTKKRSPKTKITSLITNEEHSTLIKASIYNSMEVILKPLYHVI
jgi:hypothetical protein